MEPTSRPSLGSLAAPALGLFALLTVNFLFYGSMVLSFDLPLGVWISQLFLFLLPAVAFSRAFNLRPLNYLRLNVGVGPALLGVIVFATVANYAFAAGARGMLDLVLPESWHIIDVEQMLAHEKGVRLGFVLAGVALLAPLCEEVAFRGAIQQPLVARLGVVRGLLLTAILFSALHFDPIGFLPLLELGLFFGWLLWRTGSLWASILAHSISNTTAAVLFLATGGAGRVEASADEVGATTLGYLMAAGLLFLVPLLVLLHRMTQGRAQASEANAIRTVDDAFTIGLRPRSIAARGLILMVVAAVVPVARAVAAALRAALMGG